MAAGSQRLPCRTTAVGRGRGRLDCRAVHFDGDDADKSRQDSAAGHRRAAVALSRYPARRGRQGTQSTCGIGLGIEESPYYTYFGQFSNDKKLGKGLEQLDGHAAEERRLVGAAHDRHERDAAQE